MRRIAIITLLSLTLATPVGARPTADSPWRSNRICGHLVEVNRATYEWVVSTDPTIWRGDLFVTGQASSRLAAWLWVRAVANLLGGC